jgi:hypothetical protein
MMILLLLESGCKNISVDSFCLWANPITISQEEFNKMSEETLRQIDNFNQEFEEHCGK